MSAPNRFAKTSRSLWELHDAPSDISRPQTCDEHLHAAFESLGRTQFLFSTLVKEYEDQLPTPIRTLVKDILEEIPLEIQAIQPYLSKLLYKMVYRARLQPVKIVECINPGAAASSPITVQQGDSNLKIEQLHVPESNNLPDSRRPFSLTQSKVGPARPMIDLPFVVKFTPDPEFSEQEPIEIQVGVPQRHRTGISASLISEAATNSIAAAATSATTEIKDSTKIRDSKHSSKSPIATEAEPPTTTSSAIAINQPVIAINQPVIPRAPNHGSFSSADPLSSRRQNASWTNPKPSTSQVWKNPSWQGIVRNLPPLRYALTPPPESDLLSIPPDILPGNEHLSAPISRPSPRETRPLRRENPVGSSAAETFWDSKNWGQKRPRSPRSGTEERAAHMSAFPSPSGGPSSKRSKSNSGTQSKSAGLKESGFETRNTRRPDADGLEPEGDLEVESESGPPHKHAPPGPSPTSLNLRGTLGKGLRVAYRAFGLEGGRKS